MNNFEIAKRLIEALYPLVNCGIFNTHNITGDTMQTLYDGDNGFSVEVCYTWSYFEIFGLSDREFSVLKMYYSYLISEDDEEEMDDDEEEELTEKEVRESVLNKIRIEVENIDTNYYSSVNGVDMTECAKDTKQRVLEIIDKLAESEEE